MSDSSIGLKDYHEANIVNYMRFSRTQRALTTRTLEGAFKDIEKSRLKNETMLSVSEVEDVFQELWSCVREEVEAELSHQSHTYVLLLRQLFMQAEQWHLKMQADISDLENKELLDRIKNFENEQFSGAKKSIYVPPKLEPVNDNSATMLLKEQINRLNEENHRLKDKVKSLEEKLITISDQRPSNSSKSSIASDEPFTAVNDLEKQFNNLRTEINKTKEVSSANEKNLEKEMISAKHRLLEVLEQLKLAEKELEKKFNQTAAYKNMKQMLEKKNEQIKEFKKRLDRYEPDA